MVLQRLAVEQLPARLRGRCHVVYQSAAAPPGAFTSRRGSFGVALLAHLRPVKDPFLAAEATRLLPADSVIRVLHAGGALEREMEQRARSEMESNPRYQWLGDLPRSKAMRLLARCRLLVLTSVAEGGANVVSEALACSVPVMSTNVPGSVGILGADYPGYFPVGDAKALAGLLECAARDPGFYRGLRDACREPQALVDPIRERARPVATQKLVGTAGEKAARVIAEWTAGKAGAVLDLNDVRPDFPAASLLGVVLRDDGTRVGRAEMPPAVRESRSDPPSNGVTPSAPSAHRSRQDARPAE